jgi:hypothetical protein
VRRATRRQGQRRETQVELDEFASVTSPARTPRERFSDVESGVPVCGGSPHLNSDDMKVISPLAPPSIPRNVESALQYAGRRGWAVVPMHEKRFYTRDGVRIATRDPNIIKQWGWAESFGMACGEPSRTDVFDIDDPATAGFDVDALTASTLAATTPSGGLHLFFEFAELRSRVFPWGEWRSTGLAVVLPPAPGRRWLNDLTPQPAPPVLIELVKQLIKSVGGFSPFPLLVATSDELPKPIYKALLRAMPLGPVLRRRHQRWAGSILRKLICISRRPQRCIDESHIRFSIDHRPWADR